MSDNVTPETVPERVTKGTFPNVATQFKPGGPGGPGRPPGEQTLKRKLLTIARDNLNSEKTAKIFTDFFKTASEDPNSWQAKMFLGMYLSEASIDQIDSIVTRAEKHDKDFLHYRIFKTAFDIQQRALLSYKKHQFFMAGRRAGKTELFARKIADVLADGGRAHYIHKTLTTGIEQIWGSVKGILDDMGLSISEQHRNEGTMTLDNGGFFKVSGNVTVEDREKKRGEKWHLVIIDEAQSQAALMYLIDSIIEQELIDYAGTLIVGGTGPRVRGTYWEALFLGEWPDKRQLYPDALRLNWNLTDNPFIPNHQEALNQIQKEKGLSDADPLFQREYLGRIAYDDDALVYRLGDANYFKDEELEAWVRSQPITDIRFVSGLDFGFEDSDAFSILCYSISKPEIFLIHEYKCNRTSTQELATQISSGLQSVREKEIFKGVEENHKRFNISGDEGGLGKQIAYDLNVIYKLPVYGSYKASKDLAVELLQDEVRKGYFKVRRGGPFSEESLRTIFLRNEQDQLTRVIDDETFHPDMIDSVLYAMRNIWYFRKRIN